MSITKASLAGLKSKICAALPFMTDEMTRYHLQDITERITQALDGAFFLPYALPLQTPLAGLCPLSLPLRFRRLRSTSQLRLMVIFQTFSFNRSVAGRAITRPAPFFQ